MGDKSSIEWTDATWNPTVGCDQISPGCARCYAKELHDRRHKAFLAGKDMAPQYAKPFEALQLMDDRFDAPLHWRKPRRVFVNSVSDLFHEDVPFEFIDRVFAVMALAPQHTFQILTKRAARMRNYFRDSDPLKNGRVCRQFETLMRARKLGAATWPGWPLPNAWLGVSVENQHFADERIPLLLQTPAAVRFLSCEPLLGPLNIFQFLSDKYISVGGRQWIGAGGIQWCIFGGESGPGARPMDLAWVRDGVRQCRDAGVAPFVKQLGRYPRQDGVYPDSYSKPSSLRDRKGGDPEEWPTDLRVRDFPRV